MTPTPVQNRILVTLVVVVLSCTAATGSAQDIQTITHGDRVDITNALVPGKLTLIDFYADWCGPCRALAPKLDRLATTHSDILTIRKVDIINWDSAVAAQYRIQSIPHLKLFDETGQLLAEGNAGHVIGLLTDRVGGSDPGEGLEAGNGRSIAPVFIIGGLAALAVFWVLRGKSAPNAPAQLSNPASRPGQVPTSGWFVMMQNSLEGPFAEEDLEEMLRRRKIVGDAKARRRGQSTWTTVEEVVEHLM